MKDRPMFPNMVDKNELVGAEGQQLSQPLLSVQERDGAPVLSIQPDKVERIEACLVWPARQAGQGGPALCARRNGAVQNSFFDGEMAFDRGGEQWKCPEPPAALGEKPYLSTPYYSQCSDTLMFQLEQPVRIVERPDVMPGRAEVCSVHRFLPVKPRSLSQIANFQTPRHNLKIMVGMCKTGNCPWKSSPGVIMTTVAIVLLALATCLAAGTSLWIALSFIEQGRRLQEAKASVLRAQLTAHLQAIKDSIVPRGRTLDPVQKEIYEPIQFLWMQADLLEPDEVYAVNRCGSTLLALRHRPSVNQTQARLAHNLIDETCSLLRHTGTAAHVSSGQYSPVERILHALRGLPKDSPAATDRYLEKLGSGSDRHVEPAR
jgi:hypothetical protein